MPSDDPAAIVHHGPRLLPDAPLLGIIEAWIAAARAERCPDCGLESPTAFIADIQQPEAFWMTEVSPIRSDRGVRAAARIMVQGIVPSTLTPIGEPVDFLGDFCADGEDCDWLRLSVDAMGTRMAFECRIAQHGEIWTQRGWNICLAEIGPDGRAVDPRFLRPAEERHSGVTFTRTDPFGQWDGVSTPSPYDKHFELRRRNDREPVFTPWGDEVCFLSSDPEPRSGANMVQTYHGTFHLEHLVCSDLQGGHRRTLYRNEGGQVDPRSFRRSGRAVFHSWNLERMDRNMYLQAEPDGMVALPVFLGRGQGPNAWGAAFGLADGRFFGLTGRRRGTIGLYPPFLSDHTLGISNVVWPAHHAELDEFGFCRAATPAPDGGALFTYNPEPTFIPEGEGFTLTYARGASTAALVGSAVPYFPKNMGVGQRAHPGPEPRGHDAEVSGLGRPQARGASLVQTARARATRPRGTRRRADPARRCLWLSFDEGSNGLGSKVQRMTRFDRIVALRVLRKIPKDNGCIDDGRCIRMTNASTDGFNPAVMGLIDATGYERFELPPEAMGDAFGDIPLAADGSVKLRLPTGELLLFQGVDAAGNVIGQHRRVFALPPGRSIETGVKRVDYFSQCARCHGVIDVGAHGNFVGSSDIASLPAVVDPTSLAAAAPAIDLLDARVNRVTLTWRAQMRPTGDFPSPGYLDLLRATIGEANIVRSHNASVTWS